MRDLFSERFPKGLFRSVDSPDWKKAISSANRIVLLYPDAIGLGYGPIEAEVFKAKKPWAVVSVTNGRRRSFILSRSARVQLAWRRVLERFMIGEMAAILAFIAVTPLLVTFDFLRGRR